VPGTIEDPAARAHETFLAEATDVADEVRRFEAGETAPGDRLPGDLLSNS
jgi:hypothetical protein